MQERYFYLPTYPNPPSTDFFFQGKKINKAYSVLLRTYQNIPLPPPFAITLSTIRGWNILLLGWGWGLLMTGVIQELCTTFVRKLPALMAKKIMQITKITWPYKPIMANPNAYYSHHIICEKYETSLERIWKIPQFCWKYPHPQPKSILFLKSLEQVYRIWWFFVWICDTLWVIWIHFPRFFVIF